MTEAETPTAAPSYEDAVLDISSDAVPTKKLRIDGQLYDLYGYEHLSPDQEASVTATFARFQRTYLVLDQAKNETVAKKAASKVRELRMKLIGLMTSIPYDVYSELSAAKQGKILRAIQNEIGAEAEVDDEDVDDGDGDDDLE
jgi:hypothetical protein